MLIVTGVLIGFVLVVMVGQTARTMQGTGWIPITPLAIDPPYWLGLWFGVYPTWETIGAQLGAVVFVIGSYVLAQELRVRRPRRRSHAPHGARSSGEANRRDGADITAPVLVIEAAPERGDRV
jgi:high-affinity iron transporter